MNQTTHTAIPFHICRRRIRQCAIGEKVAMPHDENVIIKRANDLRFEILHGAKKVAQISKRNITKPKPDKYRKYDDLLNVEPLPTELELVIDLIVTHPKFLVVSQLQVKTLELIRWVELMTGQKADCILKELKKTSWEDFGSESNARHAVRSLYVLRYGTPQASLHTLRELPLFAYALQQSA